MKKSNGVKAKWMLPEYLIEVIADRFQEIGLPNEGFPVEAWNYFHDGAVLVMVEKERGRKWALFPGGMGAAEVMRIVTRKKK